MKKKLLTTAVLVLLWTMFMYFFDRDNMTLKGFIIFTVFMLVFNLTEREGKTIPWGPKKKEGI
jgi:hypothetical protein